MHRRSFLKGAGVVTVAVSGGGIWRAYDQGVFSVGEGPAYKPWKDWREQSSGPLALISAAILAASPHNTQPWLFKVTESAIDLYIDTNRNVGALDPYLREEHIGIGCALENLMLAATANGYRGTLSYLSGDLAQTSTAPGPKHLAHVDLVPDKPDRTELYEAIPHRHTNRSAYLPQKPLSPQFLDSLNQLAMSEPEVRVFFFPAEVDRKKIVKISSAANSEIYADPEVDRGSNRWIRLRWNNVQKLRDGLTPDAFGLPPVAAAIVKMMPAWMLAWAAARGDKDGYSKLMLTAPLIGIITVRDRYDQANCLRAGRMWQRLHLLATARNVAGRPCNEAVEMIDYEKAHGRPPQRAQLLSEVLGDPTWQPTFVFYMGFPTLVARASPRRPVEDVVF